MNESLSCLFCKHWIIGIPCGMCGLNLQTTDDETVFQTTPEWCPIESRKND